MTERRKPRSEVNHQHYVPEFYLKRFASDKALLKINTLTRRQSRIVSEERSIKYTCFKERIYRDAEEDITRLENILQRSGTWTLPVAGRKGPLSETDARNLYRIVSHFSVRTPHTQGHLQRLAKNGVDLSGLGSDLQVAFENMASTYDAWDKSFHLVSVRILHTDADLLTSAFPTSSFDANLTVDEVVFPHHVTMAIDRRVLVHVMVKGFDLDKRVRQQFWVAPAEDQIVQRHNLGQISRFIFSDDVEYIVHTCDVSKNLIFRALSDTGWTWELKGRGERVFKKGL